MEKNYLTLEKISVYNKSFDFSNRIWEIVLKWGYFEKDTIGKQMVRSVDSVSANIAEGFGRYSKKDKVRFYRISLGSLEETEDWIRKSLIRNLITDSEKNQMLDEIVILKKELYYLIKFTNEKLKI